MPFIAIFIRKRQHGMEDVSCWERNFALIGFFSLKKMSKRLKITLKKEILVFHIITVYKDYVTCFRTVPLPRKCNDIDLIGNHYNT